MHALGSCSGGLDGLKIPQLPSILHGDVVLLDRGRLKQTSHVAASSHLHLVPALHVDCVDDVQLDDPDVISHRAKVCYTLRELLKLPEGLNFGFCSEDAHGVPLLRAFERQHSVLMQV